MTRDRARPKPWQTDWLMLKGMRKEFERLTGSHSLAGRTVLDFGCGDMPYRALFEEHGAQYIGADFGPDSQVEISTEGIVAQPDHSVDLVLSVQVLEHVRNLDQYFSEIRRVLKPDGALWLSTHGTWLYHPHPEDHRRWTRTGLTHDIETHGISVNNVNAVTGPLGTTTMIRLTGYAFFLQRIPIAGPIITAMLALVMNARGWLEELVTPPQIRADNGCVYVAECTMPTS